MINKLFLTVVVALSVAMSGRAAVTSTECDDSCDADTGIGSGPMSTQCKILVAPFGKMPDGRNVEIYTLRSLNGLEARICTYGGRIVSLKVPDRNGHLGDVVLGFDNLKGYLADNPYFGALIGRYGNRIGGASFTMDDVTYKLATNDGPNNLHGGPTGFDKVLWTARVIPGPALQLNYLSRDGDQGFPGNLNVTAVYHVTPENGVRVDYTATTDKDTVVNLTQHSYFNLAGSGDILSHKVFIDADKFTPVDNTLIPTDELRPVEDTPFDFLQPTAIGARIGADDKQLIYAKGYDHNFVLNHKMGHLDVIAQVSESTTGRIMEVLSTEPGLQFYSGNFLDGTLTGKGGHVYKFRNAFCMEPQHFPNSPNQSDFPSVALRPGQVYHNTIEFRFSTDKQ
jgi:aldose 1-epimerase